MSNEIDVKPLVTVKPGQIQFVAACHPPLPAGDYGVKISQVVKESAQSSVPWHSVPYESSLPFTVDAPRFSLSPADIHAVYPPANGTGSFDNALPHVVFTRRTLPWERTLDGVSPELGTPFPPWLCLLLLEEDELAEKSTGRRYDVTSLPIISREKESLCHTMREEVLVPALGTFDPKRYENEACLTIDLPCELFQAVAPRYDDLPYLAHVRQIDTGDKEVYAINDKGWFSLVVGNRLPRAATRHRAFLVSLEGHHERLNSKKTDTDKNTDTGKMIRLAVLGTWEFSCAESNDFKDLMKKLDVGSLHLPAVLNDDPTCGTAAEVVNGAYSMGYTALNHVMRQGEKTVSWYRGALVPLNYDKPKQVQEPVSCADELLRYDPDTGIFDTTYAAAWQLGRLLALQNQGFALALNRVRRALRAEAERLMRRAELRAAHGELGLSDSDSLKDSLMEKIANGTGDAVKHAIPK